MLLMTTEALQVSEVPSESPMKDRIRDHKIFSSCFYCGFTSWEREKWEFLIKRQLSILVTLKIMPQFDTAPLYLPALMTSMYVVLFRI
jgi:hypothetical protein